METCLYTGGQLNSLQQNLSVLKNDCFLFSSSTDYIYSLFIRLRYTKLWVGFVLNFPLFFKETN